MNMLNFYLLIGSFCFAMHQEKEIIPFKEALKMMKAYDNKKCHTAKAEQEYKQFQDLMNERNNDEKNTETTLSISNDKKTKVKDLEKKIQIKEVQILKEKKENEKKIENLKNFVQEREIDREEREINREEIEINREEMESLNNNKLKLENKTNNYNNEINCLENKKEIIEQKIEKLPEEILKIENEIVTLNDQITESDHDSIRLDEKKNILEKKARFLIENSNEENKKIYESKIVVDDIEIPENPTAEDMINLIEKCGGYRKQIAHGVSVHFNCKKEDNHWIPITDTEFLKIEDQNKKKQFFVANIHKQHKNSKGEAPFIKEIKDFINENMIAGHKDR